MAVTPDQALRGLAAVCPEARLWMLRPEELDSPDREPWIPLQHLAQAVIEAAVSGVDCIPRVLAEVERLLTQEGSEEIEKFVGFSFLMDLATSARAHEMEKEVCGHLGPKALAFWPPLAN